MKEVVAGAPIIGDGGGAAVGSNVGTKEGCIMDPNTCDDGGAAVGWNVGTKEVCAREPNTGDGCGLTVGTGVVIRIGPCGDADGTGCMAGPDDTEGPLAAFSQTDVLAGVTARKADCRSASIRPVWLGPTTGESLT